jgi:hypothetical protein
VPPNEDFSSVTRNRVNKKMLTSRNEGNEAFAPCSHCSLKGRGRSSSFLKTATALIACKTVPAVTTFFCTAMDPSSTSPPRMACFMCPSHFATIEELEVHVHQHLDVADVESSDALAAQLAISTPPPPLRQLSECSPPSCTAEILDDSNGGGSASGPTQRAQAESDAVPVCKLSACLPLCRARPEYVLTVARIVVKLL